MLRVRQCIISINNKCAYGSMCVGLTGPSSSPTSRLALLDPGFAYA
jgi:hypothetical protein